MDTIFEKEINSLIFVYLDDILIYIISVGEHWDHLKRALDKLAGPNYLDGFTNVNSLRTKWTTLDSRLVRKGFTHIT